MEIKMLPSSSAVGEQPTQPAPPALEPMNMQKVQLAE